MQVSKEVRDILFYKMEQKLNIRETISYPIIGRVMYGYGSDNPILIIEREPPKTIDGVSFCFEWNSNQNKNLISINIGTKWSGPMLKYWNMNKSWTNLYVRDDYKFNYTTGGNYSFDNKLFKCWQDALINRDYRLLGDDQRDCRFKESQALIDHVCKVISEFEAS